MHESSFRTIEHILYEICDRGEHGGGTILDVGSYNVNGTYRPICDRLGLSYTGCDVSAGPNVDIVFSAYELHLLDRTFDIVLSGQALEHMERPWIAVESMKGVLKPGGWLVLTAPAAWPYHAFPMDCWRIRVDGMRALLAGYVDVQVWELSVDGESMVDCYGIGRKPRENEFTRTRQATSAPNTLDCP